MMEAPIKKLRGFAAMSPERAREIRSMGGKKAHAIGTAHQYTKEEAAAAGRKGGAIASADRERMAEIGRKGGKARWAKETKK
jgi:uncharacterized protein